MIIMLLQILPGKNYPPATSSICDNSNDSGLGFEQHLESHAPMTINNINNNINYHRPLSTLRYIFTFKFHFAFIYIKNK